jgi:hypothetical protein
VCGCGGNASHSTGDSDGSCAEILDWQGREYSGNGVRMPPTLGERLGDGKIRGCGGPDRAVSLVAINDVDPEDAVAAAGEPLHVFLGEHSRTAGQLSPALARLLLGPACGVDGPFVVAGTFVGESAMDYPHTVSIDVDETDRPGRRYLGLVLTLLIGEETAGIKERDEFLPFASVTAKTRRLRATIECLAAARPDRGFIAVAVAAAPRIAPAPKTPMPCSPDAAAPPCGAGAGVGVSYPYDLYTHCGVRYAYFDGRLWVLEPPAGPPRSGDPYEHGLMRLIAENIAEFRSPDLMFRFAPPPVDYMPESCD